MMLANEGDDGTIPSKTYSTQCWSLLENNWQSGMLAVHHPPLRVRVPIVTIPHLTSAAAMACDLCATLFIIGAPLDVLRCASPTPACSQENYVITQNARALNKHNNHAITHSNPTEHASITTMKWTTNDQQQQQPNNNNQNHMHYSDASRDEQILVYAFWLRHFALRTICAF